MYLRRHGVFVGFYLMDLSLIRTRRTAPNLKTRPIHPGVFQEEADVAGM